MPFASFVVNILDSLQNLRFLFLFLYLLFLRVTGLVKSILLVPFILCYLTPVLWYALCTIMWDINLNWSLLPLRWFVSPSADDRVVHFPQFIWLYLFLCFLHSPTLYIGEYKHGVFAFPAVVEEDTVPVIVRRSLIFMIFIVRHYAFSCTLKEWLQAEL